MAESRTRAQRREPLGSKSTGPTAQRVRASRSITQRVAAAGSKALRASICGSAGTADAGDSGAVAGPLAGAVHHMGSLASDGLEAVLLTATVERGSQMTGSWGAEASALEQVTGIGRATRGMRVAQVISRGAGGEVSRIAAVGHVDGGCKLSIIQCDGWFQSLSVSNLPVHAWLQLSSQREFQSL